jgi:hypothetical protein
LFDILNDIMGFFSALLHSMDLSRRTVFGTTESKVRKYVSIVLNTTHMDIYFYQGRRGSDTH